MLERLEFRPSCLRLVSPVSCLSRLDRRLLALALPDIFPLWLSWPLVRVASRSLFRQPLDQLFRGKERGRKGLLLLLALSRLSRALKPFQQTRRDDDMPNREVRRNCLFVVLDRSAVCLCLCLCRVNMRSHSILSWLSSL